MFPEQSPGILPSQYRIENSGEAEDAEILQLI
jgi:hypothetical protein